MKIVVDESVSYGVVLFLRKKGYEVISIAEGVTSGLQDPDVYKLVQKNNAVLITRDHHFTNSLRFPPREVLCIIFIRKGNLTSKEEIDLVEWFLSSHSFDQFPQKLLTISKDKIKIR